MTDNMPINAFTSSSKFGILTQLKSTVSVLYNDSSIDVVALWDTGATVTCISSNIVSKLGLSATGKKRIKTPSGDAVVKTYLLSITLPNNVNIPDIEVCDSAIGNQGFDVLVGMDIITKGDFAVSNYNGKTAFSFRVPSTGLTDYVTLIRTRQLTGTHGNKRKRKKK